MFVLMNLRHPFNILKGVDFSFGNFIFLGRGVVIRGWLIRGSDSNFRAKQRGEDGARFLQEN